MSTEDPYREWNSIFAETIPVLRQVLMDKNINLAINILEEAYREMEAALNYKRPIDSDSYLSEVLPPQVANILEKQGYHLLKDLEGKKDSDILAIHNVGVTTLAIIRKYVSPPGQESVVDLINKL